MNAIKSALAVSVCAFALISSMPAGAASVTVSANPVDDPAGNVAWILDVQATDFLPDATYNWVYGSVSGTISWGDGSADESFLVESLTSPLSLNLPFNHSYVLPGSYDTELAVNYYARSSGLDCDGSTCVSRSLLLESTNELFFDHTFEVAPIPEPETYAMLLAGLGLLGFTARRRKLREAADA